MQNRAEPSPYKIIVRDVAAEAAAVHHLPASELVPIANDPPSEQLESLRSNDEQSLGSVAALKVPIASPLRVSRSGGRSGSLNAMRDERHSCARFMQPLSNAQASVRFGRSSERPEQAVSRSWSEFELASLWHSDCVLGANRPAHSCFTLRPWAEETGASCPA